MDKRERSSKRPRTSVLVRGGLIVAGIVGAGAAVFASVPHAFTTGETLTAENLNGNFTALDQRLAALEAQLAALKAPLVWTNADLLNEWTPYGANYATPSFAKDAQGVVHMRGLAKRATAPATATTFVLPPGFRPKTWLEAPVACGGSSPCEVIIKTTGETYFEAGDLAWTSLDGLTFEAATP